MSVARRGDEDSTNRTASRYNNAMLISQQPLRVINKMTI
jgi:hypothetical protein